MALSSLPNIIVVSVKTFSTLQAKLKLHRVTVQSPFLTCPETFVYHGPHLVVLEQVHRDVLADGDVDELFSVVDDVLGPIHKNLYFPRWNTERGAL